MEGFDDFFLDFKRGVGTRGIVSPPYLNAFMTGYLPLSRSILSVTQNSDESWAGHEQALGRGKA
jgi:hypothetical protein